MRIFLIFFIIGFSLTAWTDALFLRRRDSNTTSETGGQANSTVSAEGGGESDPFVIIFVSDLETKFRGHDIDRSRYVVRYIRDLQEEQLFFDGNYSNYQIKPDLVIHGGDIGRHWACDTPRFLFIGGCRTPQDEIIDIWEQLYEANIPMISTFGNHDWKPTAGTGNPLWEGATTRERDSEVDRINRQSPEFVTLTYERSAQIDPSFEYNEIPPTGAIGQSMYKATFRDFQLASFNAAYNWESYDDHGIYTADDQFRRLSNALDREKKTIFFSHFPLSSRRLNEQTPTANEAKALIREFGNGTHHFAGHYHAALIEEYNEALPHFNDYIAPYPHHWGGREPGFLAILASKEEGVLQVKTINIPGIADGEVCLPVNYLNVRNRIYGYTPFFETNFEDISLGCDRCKAGRHIWCPSKWRYICGTKLCPLE